MKNRLRQLAGLIVFVGSSILIVKMFQRFTFDNILALHIQTLGGGIGSMYHLCDGGTGPAVEKLTAVDFGSANPPKDVKNYFYSIENPKEYLMDGDDAVVVERGPYPLKKFSIRHDVAFAASTLTDAEQPNANGAVEYDVANAYIVLDQDTAITSNLQRSTADLSLDWSGTAAELASHPLLEKTMPSHLAMSDEITNLSPPFLSVLGAFNDEFNLILSLSCTAEQIANIDSAGTNTGGGDKAQCSASQMNDFAETDCACCMHDVAYQANVGGAQATFLNCNDFLDEESSTAVSTLSLLAQYDGGVAVKESGEAKYDGSGDNFIQTMYEQTTIYSPLIQTHTVNDMTFGYPSAVVGKIVPAALLSTAEKVHYDANDSARGTTVDVATAMLTGQMDDSLPFALGDVAAYTKTVAAVCSSSCEAVDASDALYDSPLGWTCSGTAPSRYEADSPDEIALGDIDCMPYSSTFATMMQCNAIDSHLSSNPNDPEYSACICADGSSDWTTEGCCLAAGMLGGEDLIGNGCLFEVEGVLDDTNYAGTASGSTSVNIGAALESYITNEPSSKSSRFTCPATGAPSLPEHELFNRFEVHQGQSSYELYYATGHPRIQQDDKSATTNSSAIYSLPASSGYELTYVPPKGLDFNSPPNTLSSGTARLVPHPIHVEAGKVPVDFFNDKDWGYAVQRAKTCGTSECLLAARMSSMDSSFVRSEATDAMGRGMPYDGLQPIGHDDGPSDSGRPVYFHQPLYLNGDAELLSQQNNSHVDSATASGNGIQIYRPIAEESDPGSFTVGDANPNYSLVQETTWTTDDGDLRSYFDIEPATGIVARSRMRFGKSYSIWECDPATNANCNRAGEGGGSSSSSASDCYQTVARTTGLTYSCSAGNVLTPKVVGGKIMPHHWYEEFTKGAAPEEIDALHSIIQQRHTSLRWWTGWLLLFFGTSMTALAAFSATACFEVREEGGILTETPKE